ncbi:hypothetical protein BaRGS_00038086 [Batillaria attramentaria]|uniref:Uncharacterized protein n=1 Tax=Batillaria attramentaria TaxID=370345 RepID=A0ABD0J6W7_9CAEN
MSQTWTQWKNRRLGPNIISDRSFSYEEVDLSIVGLVPTRAKTQHLPQLYTAQGDGYLPYRRSPVAGASMVCSVLLLKEEVCVEKDSGGCWGYCLRALGWNHGSRRTAERTRRWRSALGAVAEGGTSLGFPAS